MEIVYYLPVNRITVLSQRLFLSYIKNKEKKTKTNQKQKLRMGRDFSISWLTGIWISPSFYLFPLCKWMELFNATLIQDNWPFTYI